MHIDTTNVVSINVSGNLLSRALRFMDTFIKVIEKRGHKLLAEDSTKIVVSEQTYRVRLTEKNRRVKKETNNNWDEYDFIPSGNLSLKLDDSYPIKDWSDSKTKPLEEKLLDILAWIELRAKNDKDAAIANAIWRKNQEKQRQREEELQKQKDDEFSNFENLFRIATRYHKTKYIRDYIDKFESSAMTTNTLDEEKKKWIQWAREKADWYDPFIEKEVKLLNEIDRDTLKRKKHKYW